jgi:hypothetical protein
MPKDFRGKEYNVGDIILYPRMSGRSCEMQEAEVVQIKEFGSQRQVRNPYFDDSIPFDYRTNPRHIYKKFMDYKVQVRPTRGSRGFYRDKDAKPVWISIKENIAKA